MTLAIRRKIMHCALALLAFWPVCQGVLVSHWNANPWELCGFAMYVQPNLPVHVQMLSPDGKIVNPDQLGSTVAEAFRVYKRRAHVLGLLSPSNDLHAALLASGLTHPYVDIVVKRRTISSTGKLEERIRVERMTLP